MPAGEGSLLPGLRAIPAVPYPTVVGRYRRYRAEAIEASVEQKGPHAAPARVAARHC